MSASTVTFEPAHRSAPPPGRLRRLVRGSGTDPRWARPALLGLLAATALRFVLYRGWVFAPPAATPVGPAAATTPTRQSLGDAR